MSSPYIDSTEEIRNNLDPNNPSLDNIIRFAETIAITLDGQFSFLEEDSEPEKPGDIRQHMIQEMNGIWDTRKNLLTDLKQFFSDGDIGNFLSRAGVRPRTKEVCMNDLEEIRTLVKANLGNAVRATWDDLYDDHVSSTRRQESRTAALASLRVLSEKWMEFSGELQKAKEIAGQQEIA